VESTKGIVELKRMSQIQLIEYALQLQERNQMNTESTAWVSADGSYGEDDLVVFHPTALTDKEYDVMHNMQACDRLPYVQAILEGDLETVAKFHEEYHVE